MSNTPIHTPANVPVNVLTNIPANSLTSINIHIDSTKCSINTLDLFNIKLSNISNDPQQLNNTIKENQINENQEYIRKIFYIEYLKQNALFK
jgi:hypothetical protein